MTDDNVRDEDRKTDPAPEATEAKRLAEQVAKQLETSIPGPDIWFRLFLKLGELTDAVNQSNSEAENTRVALIELKDTVNELRESVTDDVGRVRQRISEFDRRLARLESIPPLPSFGRNGSYGE